MTNITPEERLAQALKKEEQAKHRNILHENQEKEAKRKADARRKYIVADLFCKHFPIALEITPGKSVEEDKLNFKPLDDFMEALAKCLECYQKLEDSQAEKL